MTNPPGSAGAGPERGFVILRAAKDLLGMTVFR